MQLVWLWIHPVVTSSLVAKPAPGPFVYEHGVRVAWNRTDVGIVQGGCNLVYVKMFKCASSTTAGVVRRIADHHKMHGIHGDRWIGTKEPGIWANHGNMKPTGTHPPSMALVAKLQRPAFLFTFVRSPARRCLSAYYHFRLSRHPKLNASDSDEKIKFLRDCKDDMYKYMTEGEETPHMLVRSVYSFVGVVEQYDQSVIVLSSLLGVPLRSVLYLSSKNSTADAATGGRDGKGNILVPHIDVLEEPPEVQSFANSATFRAHNLRDFDLHDQAVSFLNERFDANRAALRRQAVEFAAMRNQAIAACAAGQPIKYSKLPAVSIRNGCYWNDNGCGYPCLDNISTLAQNDAT
jgi:hypothetical protein